MKIAVLFIILFANNLAIAQDTTSVSPEKKKKEKKVRIIPLPAIAANPTAGFMFGVAPGAYWMMGDTSNTSLSNAHVTVIFTTKKQMLITAKANTVFNADKYGAQGFYFGLNEVFQNLTDV